MTNDRSYLRALSDEDLIQIAHEGDSELSLVLAERLAERIDDILDAEDERNESRYNHSISGDDA